MELYAKGQLSFLILNCLLERDFYGLDVISEIYNRSNGNISLKKPSVYSNLTRMEKQSYVSSYLKNSDLGPNRKYYSITEKGRNLYNELKAYFDRNNIDVFRDFVGDEDVSIKNNTTVSNLNNLQHLYIDKEQNLSQNSGNYIIEDEEDTNEFFDFSSIENNSEKSNNELIYENQTTANYQENIDEKQNLQIDERQQYFEENMVDTDNLKVDNIENYDSFNNAKNQMLEDNKIVDNNEKNDYNNINDIKQESEPPYNPYNNVININETVNENDTIISEEENLKSNNLEQDIKKDDAVFLSTVEVNEYNKRIYDISKDINKLKRRKSFAEDQIAIDIDSPLSASQERTRTNIKDFKDSFIEQKYNYVNEKVNIQNKKLNNYKSTLNALNEKSFKNVDEIDANNNVEMRDDAVYITGHMEKEYARKIDPPRMKLISENSKDVRLPAPKRDVSIDPSHKEILSKLYSRTKDNLSEEIRDDALYDYNDLKDYYKAQNISFNAYKKPAEKREHNTNKLYLYNSIISFVLSCVFSTIIFLLLNGTNQINQNCNFLYILLPALLLIDIGYKFYNYKKYKSWLPSQMLPQCQIWLYSGLVCACIIALNFICGLNTTNFTLYSTTLILPLVMVIILGPIRYYMKRFIIVKYWK